MDQGSFSAIARLNVICLGKVLITKGTLEGWLLLWPYGICSEHGIVGERREIILTGVGWGL